MRKVYSTPKKEKIDITNRDEITILYPKHSYRQIIIADKNYTIRTDSGYKKMMKKKDV